MSKFDKQEITYIRGKYKFYELKISDVCQFSAFQKNLPVKYNSELISIVTYMELVAQLKSLP